MSNKMNHPKFLFVGDRMVDTVERGHDGKPPANLVEAGLFAECEAAMLLDHHAGAEVSVVGIYQLVGHAVAESHTTVRLFEDPDEPDDEPCQECVE